MDIGQELEAARQRLRGYLETSSYWKNSPLSDHMREAVFSYLEAGGKYLRPCLLLWCCRALGGDEKKALPAALAVEVFHTWTLVHDDIIDRDSVRRGRPTVHEKLRREGEKDFGAGDFAAHYGQSMAMLAGDVQHGWAVCLLSEAAAGDGDKSSLALSLIRELEGETLVELVEGESLDIQISQHPLSAVGDEAILRMIKGKTASLFSFAARAGAHLACGLYSPEDANVKAMGEFGYHAGMGFQLQDDILGVIGEEKKLGKSVGGDIREGKRTLPLVYSWKQASADARARLEQIVGKANASDAEISEACSLLETLGGISYTAGIAQQHLSQALEKLNTLKPGPERELLVDLARLMIERSH